LNKQENIITIQKKEKENKVIKFNNIQNTNQEPVQQHVRAQQSVQHQLPDLNKEKPVSTATTIFAIIGLSLIGVGGTGFCVFCIMSGGGIPVGIACYLGILLVSACIGQICHLVIRQVNYNKAFHIQARENSLQTISEKTPSNSLQDLNERESSQRANEGTPNETREIDKDRCRASSKMNPKPKIEKETEESSPNPLKKSAESQTEDSDEINPSKGTQTQEFSRSPERESAESQTEDSDETNHSKRTQTQGFRKSPERKSTESQTEEDSGIRSQKSSQKKTHTSSMGDR
jgi:hypothetical protein